MKKLFILLLSITLFSGCCKDTGGEFILAGIGAILDGYSNKLKKENCEKYEAFYKWNKNLKGETIDMIIKEKIVYSLKIQEYGDYQISEINIQTGEIVNFTTINKEDVVEENPSYMGAKEDLIFFNDKNHFHTLAAYDIKEKVIVWIKKDDTFNKELVNGYFYINQYDFKNGKKEIYINQINALTGEEKTIYTFPDSIDNEKITNIEFLHPFTGLAGSLYFTFKATSELRSNDIYISMNKLNFQNKTINKIIGYSTINQNGGRFKMTNDKINVYMSNQNYVFCYNKYSGERIWANYSLLNEISKNDLFEVVGDLLIVSHENSIEAIDRLTGVSKYTVSSYFKNESFKMFKNNLLCTSLYYFYRFNKKGILKDQFISKSYCESNVARNTFKFVVTDSGAVILSDNKYISRLYLSKKY